MFYLRPSAIFFGLLMSDQASLADQIRADPPRYAPSRQEQLVPNRQSLQIFAALCWLQTNDMPCSPELDM